VSTARDLLRLRRDAIAETEWPFTVELLALDKLFSDKKYQRDPDERWIVKTVDSFDPSLVGSLYVSARANGEYAILDGLGRAEVLRRTGFVTAWCCVYYGMSLADEAQHFVKYNKLRRHIHPWFEFRAQVVAGDREARKIDKIVKEAGFELYTSAARPQQIPAIRAVVGSYRRSSICRNESLSTTLLTIRRSWFGRPKATTAEVIGGVSRFFVNYYDDEIDFAKLDEVLLEQGPIGILGRARDQLVSRGGLIGRGSRSLQPAIARELLALYNRSGAKKLNARHLEGKRE
jgi:hypothetical protein